MLSPMNRNGKHLHSPNERLSRNLVYFLQTKPEFAANIAEAVLIFLPGAIEGSNVGSATSLDDDVFIHSVEYGKMRHERFQEYAPRQYQSLENDRIAYNVR